MKINIYSAQLIEYNDNKLRNVYLKSLNNNRKQRLKIQFNKI